MSEHKLFGIIVAMATPFDENEEVDEKALRAEVRYLVEEAGVHGLVLGGSTGEGHTYTTEELRRVVMIALEESQGRVPVIPGIIVNSTRQAIEKAQAVADLEVAALQITPAHYLFKSSDDMMVQHYKRISEATDLPILIYNVVPWNYCSPALLTRIIKEIPGVIGVKQSAGDLKLVADLIPMFKEAGRGLVMSATDALLYPSFALGAHGSIAAILAAAPKLCVQLWDAVQAGDHGTALDIHNKLLPIFNAIWSNGTHDHLSTNVKCAIELQGRTGGFSRSPMPPKSSVKERATIREALCLAGIPVIE